MINTFTSLFLVTIAAIISLVVIKRRRLFPTLATVLGITALTFSSSLPAIAVPNSTVSALDSSTQVQPQNSCGFEESLSSVGDELEGLCIAQGQNGSQSDADITKEIKSKASDENNLIVRVDNGMVLLSGSVKDEKTARNLVNQVEQVPGVHFITVELGLTNKTNSNLS
jgi:hypothetical protein